MSRAGFVEVIRAATGVPVASSEGGPSAAPVRVAMTRTVYSTTARRFGMVWRVPAAVGWRSPAS